MSSCVPFFFFLSLGKMCRKILLTSRKLGKKKVDEDHPIKKEKIKKETGPYTCRLQAYVTFWKLKKKNGKIHHHFYFPEHYFLKCTLGSAHTFSWEAWPNFFCFSENGKIHHQFYSLITNARVPLDQTKP